MTRTTSGWWTRTSSLSRVPSSSHMSVDCTCIFSFGVNVVYISAASPSPPIQPCTCAALLCNDPSALLLSPSLVPTTQASTTVVSSCILLVFELHMLLGWLQVICPLEGRTWAIAESIEAGELEAVSSLYPLPPTVVSQHAQPPRRLILLTTQV